MLAVRTHLVTQNFQAVLVGGHHICLHMGSGCHLVGPTVQTGHKGSDYSSRLQGQQELSFGETHPQLMVLPTSFTESVILLVKAAVQCILPRR